MCPAQANLASSQVQAMRETADTSLPDEAVILRPMRVSDGGGGFVEEYVQVYMCPARIGLPLGGETDTRAVSKTRIADEEEQTIWLPAQTDIEETDRIDVNGRSFEVLAVRRRGNWEVQRRAIVKEL